LNRRLVIGGVLALAVLLSACGGSGEAATTTTAAASTTTTVAATTTEATTTTSTTTTAPVVQTEFTAWIEAFGEVGDCVALTYNAAGDDADYAVLPEVVDCAAAHDNEVFYRGEYPAEAGAPWPGMEALAAEVFGTVCSGPFQERTGGTYDEVPLGYWGYWPLEDAWQAGERTLACAFATLDTTEDVPLFGTVTGPSITFPGQALAVIAEFDEVDLWAYEFDGDGAVTDANLTLDRSDLEEALQAPGWSPDGTVLVYAASAPGEETDLYAVDVATGEQVQLTDTPGPEGGPEISPDGSRVLFAAHGVDGEWDLFLMDVGTFEIVALTDSPDREASADWSPDGSEIVYRRETGGQSDIWIMNADGSGQRFFRGTDADEFDPAWSPDGTRIAFISDQSGDFDIWVAPAEGEGETRLTFDAAQDEYPAWSPDSQYLVFNSDRYGYRGLFVMPADGSGISPLSWDFPAGFAAFAPAR
jgi:dipeptidyl aminopeptidase/acylaminoacyl peptidase